MMSGSKASVIVLVWNGMSYLKPCLDSVLAQDFSDFEVIVVDNGSTDGSADFVAEHYRQVRLIRNVRNLGFASGNNIGLATANGDVLVLLNQDTEVGTGWLEALVGTFDDPTVGIAGCRLLYPDGKIQHAGGFLRGARGESEHLGRFEQDDGSDDELVDAEFVTGAALAISRAALQEIGPLDVGFSPAYYEDIDWCYRARSAGFRVVLQPRATVVHHESTATGELSYERKFALNLGRLRFVLKHWPIGRLQGEFTPAELAWIHSMNRCTELMAVRHAYLMGLLSLPDILDFRGSSLDEADVLAGLLSDLRAATAEGLARHDPAPKGSAPPAAGSLESSALHRLEQRMTLREQPFSSEVPVLGRLIVAARTLWNSVATKWYVRPLVQQQTLFNTEVVSYLQGQSLDLAENIRELTTIAERVARIEEGIRGTAPDAPAPRGGRGPRTADGSGEPKVNRETGVRGESNG